MRRWRRIAAENSFRHRLLELEQRRLESDGRQREVLVVRAPRWVNVIPLFDDGRVLLVRQWRHGIEAPTLEIPGGVVERGEPEREAAERELLEETGFRARSWERLGQIHPNPAFLDNLTGSWLARDLEQVDAVPSGDGEEEIEIASAPLGDIPRMVAAGEITHALVVVAFYLLDLHTRGEVARLSSSRQPTP